VSSVRTKSDFVELQEANNNAEIIEKINKLLDLIIITSKNQIFSILIILKKYIFRNIIYYINNKKNYIVTKKLVKYRKKYVSDY
jgi:hypothetical protein